MLMFSRTEQLKQAQIPRTKHHAHHHRATPVTFLRSVHLGSTYAYTSDVPSCPRH